LTKQKNWLDVWKKSDSGQTALSADDIMSWFLTDDIDFAFPTRTLYMANDDKRQLKLITIRGQES
jgi:hypothetical protein